MSITYLKERTNTKLNICGIALLAVSYLISGPAWSAKVPKIYIEAGDNDGGRLTTNVELKKEQAKEVKLSDGREEKIDLEKRSKRRAVKLKKIRYLD